MKMNALLLADFYKVGHYFQYPVGTSFVYANLTPRKSRMEGVNEMVFFGLQYFIKEYLITYFNENFFDLSKEEVMKSYKRRIKTSLSTDLPSYNHIENLHMLGYLPIEIKALPEGSLVPMKVPVVTIKNTLPEYFWLTNFIETIMSNIIWQPCTSATIAHEYRKILNKYAALTGMPQEFIQWQGHDFSFRGMSSFESAITSGMGHLLSFTGTDTIPAIDGLEQYYNANTDTELVGGSVSATEHSIMCAGEKEGEIETFKRLITEIYPSGIVSVVSDTWDLWYVITVILPQLKSEILARDGKLVIRPDSGDPVDIICGLYIPVVEYWIEGFSSKYFEYKGVTYQTDFDAVDNYNEKFGEHHNYDSGLEEFAKVVEIDQNVRKGVVELLWDVFGGTLTSTGHKLLDSHIGAIYGDSITRDRATQICKRLMAKGFASQVVFGIGSYTYQYNTRDTFGTAMKATYVEIDSVGREIWKDPITDDGTKKSATGLLKVVKNDMNGKYELLDKVSWEEESEGELIPVFRDGVLLVDQTLGEIRARLAEKSKKYELA